MDTEKKVELVCRPPTEEVITIKEVRELFESKDKPNHYIGYEISGQLHIGSLILAGLKIKDLIEAGCKCRVFLADWHAWINNKMEGNWDKIHAAAQYYKEAFQLISPKIEIILGSDLYHNNDEFWKNLFLIAKHTTLARGTKCLTIMGRKEGEAIDIASYIYPALQVADIKEMEIDIAHAGMDQRKAHMLARDVFPKLGWKPPVALHHHLIPGLLKPEAEGYDENKTMDLAISAKMTKSKPWTCLFIHDSKEELIKKMEKAWCPEKTVVGNGPLEYVKYLIFHEFRSFDVKRPAKFGGDISFDSYEEVEKEFVAGRLHPMDLKMAVVEYIDKIIAPYRKYFEKPAKAKLLDVYKETKITR